MLQHHIKHHTPHQTHHSLWFRGTRRPCGCFCLILLNSPLLDKHIHTRRSTHPSQLVAFENITFCLYMPTPLAAHTRMHAHTQTHTNTNLTPTHLTPHPHPPPLPPPHTNTALPPSSTHLILFFAAEGHQKIQGGLVTPCLLQHCSKGPCSLLQGQPLGWS